MNDVNQGFGITLQRGLYFRPDYDRQSHLETLLEDYACGSLIHPKIGAEGFIPELPTLWIALRTIEIASIEFCLKSREERRVKFWIPEEEISLIFFLTNGSTFLEIIWIDGREIDCGSEIHMEFCRNLTRQIGSFIAENADDFMRYNLRKHRELQFIFGGSFDALENARCA